MSKALYHQPGVPAPQSFEVKATRNTDAGIVVDLADAKGNERITSCPVADKPAPGFATLVPDEAPAEKGKPDAPPAAPADDAAQKRIKELEAQLAKIQAESAAAADAPPVTLDKPQPPSTRAKP